MTCLDCRLAAHCSGIGACAGNRKRMKAYLEKYPGRIIAGDLAKQICRVDIKNESFVSRSAD